MLTFNSLIHIDIHRHMAAPQIRKPLNPSSTCPSNFKINPQGSNLQFHNSANDNQVCYCTIIVYSFMEDYQSVNKQNGIVMEFTPKDPIMKVVPTVVVPKPKGIVYSTSAQNLPSECMDGLRKSDNKENSSKQSQSVCLSEGSSFADLPQASLSSNSDSKIIQSNQKLSKLFSRIPVLIKR